jgi:hypothetical protein
LTQYLSILILRKSSRRSQSKSQRRCVNTSHSHLIKSS